MAERLAMTPYEQKHRLDGKLGALVPTPSTTSITLRLMLEQAVGSWPALLAYAEQAANFNWESP